MKPHVILLILACAAFTDGCRSSDSLYGNPEAAKKANQPTELVMSVDADPQATPVLKGAAAVQWMSFEEAVAKAETEKRKIFIDVYTDWCGWCKVMDSKTFTDPYIAGLLNEQFYAVKFNAEQREDVVFRGHTFRFVQSGRGGYHEFAASLLNNKLSYPNFVFLNQEFQIIPVVEGSTSLPGFRKPEDFHLFLSYVGNDHYKKMTLKAYQGVYASPFKAAD